ncbi:hypothetical protein MNV49_001185 [Pseudohyphozyma bogoriensis]|nr:hypothetical protein MNV49_001185 [Pseudohyphozyma bogoriensis]
MSRGLTALAGHLQTHLASIRMIPDKIKTARPNGSLGTISGVPGFTQAQAVTAQHEMGTALPLEGRRRAEKRLRRALGRQ